MAKSITCFCRAKAGDHEKVRLILPAKAVNENSGFTLSCQLSDSAILGTIFTPYPAQLRNSQ